MKDVSHKIDVVNANIPENAGYNPFDNPGIQASSGKKQDAGMSATNDTGEYISPAKMPSGKKGSGYGG